MERERGRENPNRKPPFFKMRNSQNKNIFWPDLLQVNLEANMLNSTSGNI